MGRLVICDDAGGEFALDAASAGTLLALTDHFEAATVSACPQCGARVLAAVAVVDVLDNAPPHPATTAIINLADEAPTLHLYVIEPDSDCAHRLWHDPGYDEWLEIAGEEQPRARH
jgi:hypothetical protein